MKSDTSKDRTSKYSDQWSVDRILALTEQRQLESMDVRRVRQQNRP